MKKIKVGFSGLSHLGICYLIATALKGYNVVGFDEDSEVIKNLNNKIFPIYEPHLKNALQKVKKKIVFTDNIYDLKNCNIVFMSKDVPTLSSGKSDLDSVKRLINKTLKILEKNTVVVILSQVLPGFTEKLNWNKKLLYYQVETLIFGKGLSRAQKPDRLIVGSNNLEITKIYKEFLKSFKCEIIQMNYVSAELSKISINIFLILSISYANSMSEVAEKIGADWGKITKVLKSDNRIGHNSYLTPGFGIGGSNLKRDILNLITIIKPDTKNFFFYKTLLDLSKKRIEWLTKILNKHIKKNLKISILGVTYKENTNSIKNSPAIQLIIKFINTKFYYYDPVVKNLNQKFKNVHYAKSKEILKNSNILILLSPWSEFYKISLNSLLKNKKLKIIIDPYGVFANKNFRNIKYYSFGGNNEKK